MDSEKAVSTLTPANAALASSANTNEQDPRFMFHPQGQASRCCVVALGSREGGIALSSWTQRCFSL